MSYFQGEVLQLPAKKLINGTPLPLTEDAILEQ